VADRDGVFTCPMGECGYSGSWIPRSRCTPFCAGRQYTPKASPAQMCQRAPMLQAVRGPRCPPCSHHQRDGRSACTRTLIHRLPRHPVGGWPHSLDHKTVKRNETFASRRSALPPQEREKGQENSSSPLPLLGKRMISRGGRGRNSDESLDGCESTEPR
jgi:hypothetical protein